MVNPTKCQIEENVKSEAAALVTVHFNKGLHKTLTAFGAFRCFIENLGYLDRITVSNTSSGL